MIKLQKSTVIKLSRQIFLALAVLSLSGCLYWLRAFQVYQQLDEFDRHFEIAVAEDFTLRFKHPVMYSEDFVSLSGLKPSSDSPRERGKRWRYWFRKVDENRELVEPEIKFFFDLEFNRYDRLAAWSFSSLFLQIAPPEFLEVSLRSLAGAEIDEGNKQLRGNTDHIDKIVANLPKKAAVVRELGAPIEIKKAGKDQEVYLYHFLLDSPEIKAGYEDRVLSIVKLTFDASTQELIKMSGRFAGLKISISYRKFLEPARAAL
ncbi:MAG: hypothetical protein ACU85E_03985 [Gammaproteobacteria bacterium]